MIQSYEKTGKLDKDVEKKVSKIVSDFLRKTGIVLTILTLVGFIV